MDNPEDIKKTLKIMDNMSWKQRKVFIAMIGILRRKGGRITEEELIKELEDLNVLEMGDLEFRNFVRAMDNIYPPEEN